MRRKLVCVGGTGQMVLHWYLQLYVLGLIKTPFEAIVIDTDDVIKSIETIDDFFRTLQYSDQPGRAFGEDIPEIKIIRIASPEGDNVYHALTGVRASSRTSFHPSRAFFNEDTLTQTMKQGLYARPAISSVVARDIASVSELNPTANSTVVVVGSLIGGTGGGLTAPVIDAIRANSTLNGIDGVKIRAVLFGEYFSPDTSRIEGDNLRFQSNRTLVLSSISESINELHSYHLVGGPGSTKSYDRNPEAEKIGKNIPWPEDQDFPTWHGAQAVEYLFNDAVTDIATEFKNKEIKNFRHPVVLKEARAILERRIRFVNELIKKEAVLKMAQDPFSRLIWGVGIVRTIAHFWNIAAKIAGGKNRVKDFPTNIQNQLERLWYGNEMKKELQKVFPILTGTHGVPPRLISKVAWPEVQDGHWYDKLFPDVDETAKRTSATLLFKSLREGQ